MTNKPLVSFKLTSTNCVKYYLRDAALWPPLLVRAFIPHVAFDVAFEGKADMPLCTANVCF